MAQADEQGKLEDLGIFWLPQGISFGHVTLYRPGDRDSSGKIPVQGTLTLPRDARVFLEISQEVCDDLRLLRDLPRRFLQNGISITEKSLANADFTHLIGLDPPARSLGIVLTTLSQARLKEIGRLTHLECLQFIAATLLTTDWSWLSGLTKLRGLKLNGTKANNACLRFIRTLESLEELSLARTRVHGNAVACLWMLPYLKLIDLSGTSLNAESFAGIGGAAHLRTLALDETRIGDRDLGIISNANQLTSISLKNTRITDEGISHLAKLRGLKTLHLRSGAVTDKSIGVFTSWKNLSWLDIRKTGITANGIKFLKKELPKCLITC